MATLTRRSVIRGSLGLVAASSLARPHVANAASTTAEVWWTQGFAQEEDVAFKKLIADYEKASGNKIEENSKIPWPGNGFLNQSRNWAVESTCPDGRLVTSVDYARANPSSCSKTHLAQIYESH